MKKVIWYLHHYAGGPTLGMSYRPYYLSQHFQHQGYAAYIIGAHFHHLLQQVSFQKKAVHHEVRDDVNYIWLKTPHYQKNGLKRVLNMFSYSARLYCHHQQIVQLTQKPDVIIVSSSHLFHYPFALKLAKKFNAKIIFEVRDLWPLSVIQLLGISKYNPLVKLMSVIEKSAYRQSDYVVSLLSNSHQYMKTRGLDVAKFRYIPNGADENATDPVMSAPLSTNIENKIRQKHQQGYFLIGYAGAHGIPNALGQMIEALGQLQQCHAVKLHVFFIGEGNQKVILQQRATDLALNNITFLEQVNKYQIHHFFSYMDALFLGWQNKPIYQYGISPNKLFDYMLAAKPIIHASNALEDPVFLAECGMIVTPDSPLELAMGLKKLALLPKETLMRMGRNGQNYVLKNHNYKLLAQQYIELFK